MDRVNMKKLMKQYRETVTILYHALIRSKGNSTKYSILLSEYQNACFVHRQLRSYCKARGII